MANLINLTPHAIVVESETGTQTTYSPSGTVARVEMETKVSGEVGGFPVVTNTVLGHNLPDPVEGTYLLVSAMVLTIAKELGRSDCLAPDTNRAKRNEKGHIVSVPGFVA